MSSRSSGRWGISSFFCGGETPPPQNHVFRIYKIAASKISRMAVRAVTMRNTSVQHCSPVPPFLTIATISELSWLATRQEFRLSGGLSTTRAQFSLCAGVDSALSSVDHFADDRLPELPVRPHEAALGVKRPDRAPNRRLHCLSVDKHHEIPFCRSKPLLELSFTFATDIADVTFVLV